MAGGRPGVGRKRPPGPAGGGDRRAGRDHPVCLHRRGRLARVSSPLGHVVRMEYDWVGQLVAVVDPRGRRREYRYDPDGRIIRMTFGWQAWSYGYDAAGRLVSRREPHGGQTRYGYDPAGRLTGVIDPLGGRAAPPRRGRPADWWPAPTSSGAPRAGTTTRPGGCPATRPATPTR